MNAHGKGRSNLDPKLKIFNDEFKDKTIVISEQKTEMAVRHLLCPSKGNQLDLTEALKMIYTELGICSLYIEGGAALLSSFLEQQLVDRVSIYIAPKFLGGGKQVELPYPASKMQDALFFETGTWKKFNRDVVMLSKRNICLPD